MKNTWHHHKPLSDYVLGIYFKFVHVKTLKVLSSVFITCLGRTATLVISMTFVDALY